MHIKLTDTSIEWINRFDLCRNQNVVLPAFLPRNIKSTPELKVGVTVIEQKINSEAADRYGTNISTSRGRIDVFDIS